MIIKKSSRIEKVMAKEQNDDTVPVDWRDLVTNDGVFAVDSQQNVVYLSDSAQRILGYSPEDVVGKPCYELVAGRDSQNYRFRRRNCPAMENARRGRTTGDYDILCLLPTGEAKWINISIAVPKRKRHDFQVLHLFRDVTRRRRTEEFARKAGTALRDLLDEEKPETLEEVEPSSLPLPRLSRRELEVLRLLAAGMSTRQIAATLDVQPVTARTHITRSLQNWALKTVSRRCSTPRSVASSDPWSSLNGGVRPEFPSAAAAGNSNNGKAGAASFLVGALSGRGYRVAA